ncbi:MAG TPA: hypothetical protein VH207_15565 [Chthoniobacterales bacterium]|jgi:hypothetical protein|nr:hypothetical protein [Chthoniobacterales bacterium]
MIRPLAGALLFLFAITAEGQIQVDLKFKRLQYIAFEPVIATVTITNLAGRAIALRNSEDLPWYGFEVTAKDGRTLPPLPHPPEPPLEMAAGSSVTRKINLTPLFPITDLGIYHVRANVYFADLNKFFYAKPKVIEVTNARPIWQRTVGDPESSGARTYSLMTNRFPDHTSLYVRVEDRENSLVYGTYSLGRVISFDEPQAEIDRQNQLHVLQPSAPRVWSYSVVGLDGRLLKHASYSQARSMPRLRRTPDGAVEVVGGVLDAPASPAEAGRAVPKLSDRPANLPPED